MTRLRLIVNADDFGLSPGANAGILSAHRNGVLTSTTVLANLPAAAELEDACRSDPELGFGLHANLTLGAPICDPSRVSSLVGREGQFLSPRDLVRRLARWEVERRHVYAELCAQCDRLRTLGLQPTHWDAHQTVAYWPILRQAAIAAAADSGIRAARSPRVWVAHPKLPPRLVRLRWRTRRFRRAATEFNRALGRRALSKRFTLPDWQFTASLVDAALDREQRWEATFRLLPSGGTCEVVSHPAIVDDEIRARTPALTDERELDLDALCSPTVLALVRERATLISFRDLTAYPFST